MFNPETGGEGFYLTAVDGLDAGQIRAPVEAIPQRDGAVAYSFFRGARYPVLRGIIRATSSTTARRELEDTLRAYTDSLLREEGVLRFTPSGATPRQMTVRLLEPLAISGGAGMVPKEFQLGLICPTGVIESELEYSLDTTGLTPGQGSWVFAHVFPFSFGDATSGGTATVHNGGTVPTFPILKIYGGATSPKIQNVTTGLSLSLSGLILSDGDYAEITMQAESVTLNGSESVSLIGGVDIATSDFWALEPGPNVIQLTAGAFTPGAKATIAWRDGYA